MDVLQYFINDKFEGDAKFPEFMPGRFDVVGLHATLPYAHK
jgi:hypothetical protein